MKIIELRAQNVLNLKAVRITPDRSLVIISGKNGAGKSNVLNTIGMGLEGKRATPGTPVRKGEDKGTIDITLDDLVVHTVLRPDGNRSLVVSNREGTANYSSPQAMLNGLIGPRSFDPVAFASEPRLKQLETLRALLGLDFTALDAERKAHYAERAVQGRDVTSRDNQIKAMPHFPDAPSEEPVVLDLVKELEAAQAVNLKRNEVAVTLRARSEELAALEQEVAEIKRALAAKSQALVAAQQAHLSLAAAVDLNPIKDKIANAETIQKQVQANASRAAVQARYDEAKAAYDNLTEQIEGIDAKKAEQVKAAKFPVKGLALSDDGVMFNDLPFDQASSAEQLRVSVAMGIALNPKLKVLLIRDGSLLDEDSLAMIGEMADEAGAQIWIERVGDGEECSVVIEDGSVVGAE